MFTCALQCKVDPVQPGSNHGEHFKQTVVTANESTSLKSSLQVNDLMGYLNMESFPLIQNTEKKNEGRYKKGSQV